MLDENMDYGFDTLQIHAGEIDDLYHSLVTPIYMTTTYAEYDAPESEKYVYSRTTNPTVTRLQNKMAALEKAEAALACCSGMGAISTALWAALQGGDEVVCNDTLYSCAYLFFKDQAPKFGISAKFVDFNDLDAVAAALSEKTKIVYFETPCNPTMKVIDIQAIASLVHRYREDIMVFVDNTFCSPYIQNPITLGADVVIHSATKYIGGHGDVLAGFVCGRKDFIKQCVELGIKILTGACLSPMNAFLLDRSLKTLDIRMEKHSSNAMKVAEFLNSHPAVNYVNYPGLEGTQYHEIAKKQMRCYGGMLAADFKGTREQVREALSKLKLATFAVSLGDTETLIEHAATQTHRNYSVEDMKAVGITEGLCRISIGLENPDDLIRDFDQALNTLL